MEKKYLQISTINKKWENEIFPKRFNEIMSKRGIQNKELACLLSVTPSTVSGWRTGYRMPDIGFVAQIAKLLCVSSDYLLGIVDECKETTGI